MTPGKFLRLIWPSTGFYCIAHPFKPEGSDTTVYTHKVFHTIGEAVTHVHEQQHRLDTYFAVLSMREERVWDPEKTDYKTGQKGAWAQRLQSNMLASKCSFFDLDVGNDAKKYATQADALKGLIEFVNATLLPMPTLVSSGGGVHVYWHYDVEVPALEWRDVAWQLRQLAEHLGLKVDPTRTIDTSSVLRVPDTFNWKDRQNPRKVVVLQEGAVTPFAQFKQLVQDALIKHGVIVTSAPVKTAAPVLPAGLAKQEFTDHGPAPTLDNVLSGCAQMREVMRSQADPSHPHYGPLDNTAWYRGMLGVMKHVVDGDNWCRKVTAIHPRSVADIEAKLKQLETYPPARCDTLRQYMPWGESPCQGCKFFPGGVQDPSVPNPIAAGRRSAIAPAPSMAPPPPPPPPPPPNVSPAMAQLIAPSPVLQSAMIPQPPSPYERLANGHIALNRKDKDGNDQQSIIYTNDLYPLKRLVNPDTKTEQQVWRVVLPREGAKSFTIDADALYDSKKFTVAAANNGLYPNKADLPALQDYMVAYIKQLQRDLDADFQTSALGWNEDHTTFTFPDKVLLADGTARPAALTEAAATSTQHVGRKGSLARQVELLQFYNHPDYIANQFAILCSLGSILLHMTGHHGVVVNMSGESGASKSTTLYTALSLWGHPKLLPINGTNRGATANARGQRIMVNGSIPTGVDEITHMPSKDAIDLTMSVSQPGHRLRLGTDGVERSTGSGGTKSAIMLTTANSSLHSLISADTAAGTAGSMRVFEMRFAAPRIHTKAQADDFLRELEQNYGWIGEPFVQFVVRFRAKIEARMQQIEREFDQEAGIISSERYWSATVASALVAGEIAHAIGLLPYDVAAIRSWAAQRQIPYMRGVVREEYRGPLDVLMDYISEKHGSIVVIEKSTGAGVNTISGAQGGARDFASNQISGALLGHYDMASGVLYLLKQGFKDHCSRAGGSSTRILEELHQPRLMADQSQRRIVVDKNTRRTLGAGTILAKGQSWCFVVDMTHPDIAGAAPVLAASGGFASSPPAGQLKAVS